MLKVDVRANFEEGIICLQWLKCSCYTISPSIQCRFRYQDILPPAFVSTFANAISMSTKFWQSQTKNRQKIIDIDIEPGVVCSIKLVLGVRRWIDEPTVPAFSGICSSTGLAFTHYGWSTLAFTENGYAVSWV